MHDTSRASRGQYRPRPRQHAPSADDGAGLTPPSSRFNVTKAACDLKIHHHPGSKQRMLPMSIKAQGPAAEMFLLSLHTRQHQAFSARSSQAEPQPKQPITSPFTSNQPENKHSTNHNVGCKDRHIRFTTHFLSVRQDRLQPKAHFQRSCSQHLLPNWLQVGLPPTNNQTLPGIRWHERLQCQNR